MNRIITDTDSENKKGSAGETRSFTETIRKVAEFDFSLQPERLIKQVPFLLYLCFWIFLFIYSSHRAERIIRETDKLNKEVKDLRSEYISVLSEQMGASKQSSVAKKLEPFGIKELKSPPAKITYSDR